MEILLAQNLQYDSQNFISDTSFALLQNTSDHIYIAQSGLIGKDGIDSKSGRADYHVENDYFKLAGGQDQLVVPLTFEKDSVIYRKIFVLKRGAYDVAVNFEINNQTARTIEVTICTIKAILGRKLRQHGYANLYRGSYSIF